MTSSLVFPAVVAFLFGGALGSFANVVIYRLPRKLSVAHPPSACPSCNTPIQPRDNVPVLGWILLGGRCRTCQAKISIQYPVVELVVGLAFALIVTLSEPRYWFILMVFTFASITLSLIDLQVRKLPNAITYPLLGVLAGGAIILSFFDDRGFSVTTRGLVAGLVLFIFYAVVWFIYPRGIGLGDVKLAPSIGVILGVFGWGSVMVGAFSGFLVGSLVGVVAMVRARQSRKVSIPFGPSIIAGAWIGIFWGESLWNSYLSLVGLGN